MSDVAVTPENRRTYWLKGNMNRVAIGVTGLIAVLVALKVTAHPLGPEAFENQHHLVRLIAFASLTVWMTLTIGIRRSGAAAISVLAFACFVELVIIPARGFEGGTLTAANLGIVLAYCGMKLYGYAISKPRALAREATD